MLLVKNTPFTNVVANGVATVNLPIGMSYNKIILALGGTTFTKSMITNINVKVNGKIIYQALGSRLDLINQYRGLQANGGFLTIDFTEPRAKSMVEQYVGNINTASGVSSLTVEVTIAGATAPTLDSYTEYNAPAPLGVIAKQILFTSSFAGSGKFPMKLIDITNRGGLIKRVHFAHGGNLSMLEVKKNGIVIHDNVPTAVNSFWQGEYQKTAQPNIYTYDPCADNNYANAVKTADATALEFNPTFTAADTVTAVVEVLDVLGNM
ncbi:major capsid protein P2 [Caballeronia sp. LZ016]|uniref:major capsid protein P2 n=1 Tax=Caballeronia sp. LZ016 TaxID=3038554 RepID=UPI00286480FB|nr:major capsid protein P2 [Caballeronia sp. LZ016]MDR5739497.1 major capsid protein P2 [Caballeronia sp. LZ016]